MTTFMCIRHLCLCCVHWSVTQGPWIIPSNLHTRKIDHLRFSSNIQNRGHKPWELFLSRQIEMAKISGIRLFERLSGVRLISTAIEKKKQVTFYIAAVRSSFGCTTCIH